MVRVNSQLGLCIILIQTPQHDGSNTTDVCRTLEISRITPKNMQGELRSNVESKSYPLTKAFLVDI